MAPQIEQISYEPFRDVFGFGDVLRWPRISKRPPSGHRARRAVQRVLDRVRLAGREQTRAMLVPNAGVPLCVSALSSAGMFTEKQMH